MTPCNARTQVPYKTDKYASDFGANPNHMWIFVQISVSIPPLNQVPLLLIGIRTTVHTTYIFKKNGAMSLIDGVFPRKPQRGLVSLNGA